jgi:hypothetical protein
LNVQKVPRGPQKYYEVAESVLCRMKVVDCFDVETFGSVDVFEDFPVGACRPGLIISALRTGKIECVCLRALKQGYEEAGYVQRYCVENHQAAKPLVELRRKYAYELVNVCDVDNLSDTAHIRM